MGELVCVFGVEGSQNGSLGGTLRFGVVDVLDKGGESEGVGK